MMGKSKKRKPAGYWEDIENLKKEILPLCENIGGMPTAGEMEANGIFFSKKLHKELGGFPGLTKMLGFEKRPGNQAKPITIFGEVFPSRLAAAEHYKINLQTFRGRLRKGWTPEDAATKTVASDVTIEVDGLSFPAIAALATHYKVEYKLVHRKIRTYLFWNDQ